MVYFFHDENGIENSFHSNYLSMASFQNVHLNRNEIKSVSFKKLMNFLFRQISNNDWRWKVFLSSVHMLIIWNKLWIEFVIQIYAISRTKAICIGFLSWNYFQHQNWNKKNVPQTLISNWYDVQIWWIWQYW